MFNTKVTIKMEEWMRDSLKRNFNELTHTFPVMEVLIHLRGTNIFGQSDYELIMNDSVYRTDEEKRIAILDKLITREARGYWSFCHSIRLRYQRIFDDLHTLNADLCTECNGQQDKQACNNCIGNYHLFFFNQNKKLKI